MAKSSITFQATGAPVHGPTGAEGLFALHGIHDREQMQEAGWYIAPGVGCAGGFYTYSRHVAELAARRLNVEIEVV